LSGRTFAGDRAGSIGLEEVAKSVRLLGKVLIALGTIVFVLFIWVATDPYGDLTPLVMLGMPLLVLSLYAMGFLARFIRMPKE
jgi:hypothetical protein